MQIANGVWQKMTLDRAVNGLEWRKNEDNQVVFIGPNIGIERRAHMGS